jgi:predicted PurR-regulated permease PerM
MFGLIKRIAVFLSVLLLVVFLLSLSGVKLHQVGDALVQLSKELGEKKPVLALQDWAHKTFPKWGKNLRQKIKKHEPPRPTKKRAALHKPSPPEKIEKITEAERRELERLIPEE